MAVPRSNDRPFEDTHGGPVRCRHPPPDDSPLLRPVASLWYVTLNGCQVRPRIDRSSRKTAMIGFDAP